MIPERLVFIDLETTGASSFRERITEIGLYEVLTGETVREWSSLVNPEKPISSFIEKMTGISSAMVADAPTFPEVASELYEILRDKVLVAHNARFDYGFLKREFRQAGLDYNAKTLCTVRLSRSLYPEHRKHSLDEIVRRHRLKVKKRHRALDDARLVRDFFAKVNSEFAHETVRDAVRTQLRQPSLPSHLPPEQIENLPSSPGVYLFYGDNDAVLYIGKSVDIRSRILAHFSGDHRVQKGMKLSRQVRRIETFETAGELGALLLESKLIKELAPIHNRRLRRTREVFSIRITPSGRDGSLQTAIIPLGTPNSGIPDTLFGTFRTRRQAENTLREIVREQGLCNKVLGLEKGSGACFNYQVKKCRGACVGAEPLPLHDARLSNAFAGLRIRPWPWPGVVGIRETSPAGDKSEVHLFDRWSYLGTTDSDEKLWEMLAERTPQPFDLDSYKILTRFLGKRSSHIHIVDFSQERTRHA